MTTADDRAIIDLYNLLLEAERAGVQVLGQLIDQAPSPPLKDLLVRFRQDEGLNCRILTALIQYSGGEPSQKTGDFVAKVAALDTLDEKIKLLIRGQKWVARQIQAHQWIIPAGSAYFFLEAMRRQHLENVAACLTTAD